MKYFDVELRDLSSGDLWTQAKVYYEGDSICEVECENGRVWELKELSIADLASIHRHHILKLEDDHSSEGVSAEEFLTIHDLRRFG